MTNSPTKRRELMNTSQAERVLWKFGGATRLSLILKAIGRPRNASSIHRWTYPKESGGTGGTIPTRAWEDLFLAARAEGILLTSSDLDPREKFMTPERAKAFPRRIKRRPGQKVLNHDEQEVLDIL